jgi:hypothetical protein
MPQELVFIGQGIDELKITQALDNGLLTEEEWLQGKSFWITLLDPFSQRKVSLNSAQAVTPNIGLPDAAKGCEMSALTDIYNDEVNIVVWPREINTAIENYASSG